VCALEIQTVAIVGLGALGVLFGHHLSKRLPEGALKVVASADRIARYEREGVFCNGSAAGSITRRRRKRKRRTSCCSR
jgi:ketopantoate reductase